MGTMGRSKEQWSSGWGIGLLIQVFQVQKH